MFWLGVLATIIAMWILVIIDDVIKKFKEQKELKQNLIDRRLDSMFEVIKDLKVRVDEMQYSTIPLLEVRVNSCDDREF